MHDPSPIAEPVRRPNPLLGVHHLHYRYPDGTPALGGIDLEIAAGERIALVGRNGSGKTTLIKQLCGLLAPGAGAVSFKGQLLQGAHLAAGRLCLGYLFQDPDDQLFGHTLIDDVAFGPRQQGLSAEQAEAAARDALARVHLADKAYKEPHHLSFGQKKRAALAGLLAMQPEVLLLDEPTANLDPRQEQVFLDLLKTFPGTLICVSHDLLFLYELCRRAVVLDAGRVAHDYSLDELVTQRGELRAHGLDFSFRLVLTPEAEEASVNAAPVCLPSDAAAAPLVALEQYRFRYPDGTLALDCLDLAIGPGERIALVGENGAGKSTLLSCLLGLQQGSGRYDFDGRPVDRRLRKNLWREMGLVFQDCADQLFCASVDDEIDFGLRRLGLSRSEMRQRREAALAMVDLEGFGGRVPLHLSGGERKRLALACVLAMRPRLLILDEPTAGLDPGSEAVLLEILRGLSATLLLVSHDMFFVEALTCRTLVMHQGQILRDLATADFLRDRNLGSLNGLAYSYRQQGSDAIRALQHAHELQHVHSHRHADTAAAPAHVHAHTHRIVHSHPGDDRPHEHPPRRFYGDEAPDHSHDPEHDH